MPSFGDVLDIASGGLEIAESALEAVPGLPALVAGFKLLVDKVQLVREVDDRHSDFLAQVDKLKTVIGTAAKKVGFQNAYEICREDRKIVDSIPWADAGYWSVDELKSGFMQGTRKELFTELESWSHGRFPEDKPKRVCYLSGGAGLGKSSIVHQLCVRLDAAERHPLRLGASLLFVRGRGDLESARLFFPTLTRQLAQTQLSIRPHIFSAAREYLVHGEQQWMQHTLQGLLRKALIAAPANQPPTLLVIDGIDECKDGELVPDLLRSSLSLVREFLWLYVFAAWRPEPHILSVLASPDFADIVHHMGLEDTLEDWGDDVELYLKETVPRIPSYADFPNKHPRALERLINAQPACPSLLASQ
ncbi:uncharacterized protein PHACADRAFT_189612 [Phanerochaete carnosa HHB-10118-sp]|uniref:Nephrocystin 3-like N-terminal domain-containing protein n=1 Tax=Phanerochaete carnosa (strain HHB-10118-sp) TaxID=650164 RepID=K5XBX0_PHACS|nr:uncharacterized protein PHACADRAFT_189612 [Phanerochaete carnosa HHB-10118-sp]EKM60477.1 hypothetical protein PHACADRAFT_189612 [Phanerochaete carnosa HHB-10118-sp]